MTQPTFVLSVRGVGSTGEVTITIVEKIGARRAGLTLDGVSREYAFRPFVNEAQRREYPSLYAAMAAAADVAREEGWPCNVRIVMFKGETGPDREALKDDALTRGREVIQNWEAGRMTPGEDVVRVIADLIARAEAAETKDRR